MLWPWQRKTNNGDNILPKGQNELATRVRQCGIDPAGFRLYFGQGDEAIYGFTSTGRDSVNVWKKLTAAVDRTGHRPVVLGVDDDLSFHKELIEEFGDQNSSGVRETIRLGEELSPDEFLKSAANNWIDDDDEFNIADYHGEWPGPAPQQGFGITTLSNVPLVHIGLAPTVTPWHLPAYLRFGGWNDCPPPSAHVAMFKYWYEKYGAVPVNMTHDVVEMYVAKPIRSKEEAISVAEEHFWYCTDIVMQGTETIEALAATLLDANQWYFWWD